MSPAFTPAIAAKSNLLPTIPPPPVVLPMPHLYPEEEDSPMLTIEEEDSLMLTTEELGMSFFSPSLLLLFDWIFQALPNLLHNPLTPPAVL